jgi:serine/threonine-protein kinase
MNVDCGSARDRLGRTLDGKYTLREVLGAGGTAVVFRAVQSDGTEVAVKMLHDHLSRSDEVCRRFVREGQLGNVLDHPGTVRVLDHGSSHDGCPYLVLEFLDGESLEERRVKAGGRLELWETLDYCDQLLSVLEIAHAKNVVHRDIKPSNLFLHKNGRLKVLDFGIARLVDDTSATSTKTGQMVGTPAFMPPEQALSRPRDVDARTDIWAVGATLFTLLSGEHVHIAETSSEHLVKAATLHARSLAKALPGVPANVEALVARCLSFDKNERWSSAASMRQELTFVRSDPGRRIGTTSAPPPERTPSNPNMPTIIGDTSSVRMRAAADMPTTFSDSAPISSPISSSNPLSKATPLSDRHIDSVANMALSSNPGAYDLVSKRKWVLPLAIGSSLALIGMTVVALLLAFRSPAPVQVVSATPGPSITVSEVATTAATVDGPKPADTAGTIEIPDPEPAPNTATPATTAPTPHPAVTPVVTVAAPVRPQPLYQPTASAPPAKKPTSHKDVYKPF